MKSLSRMVLGWRRRAVLLAALAMPLMLAARATPADAQTMADIAGKKKIVVGVLVDSRLSGS